MSSWDSYFSMLQCLGCGGNLDKKSSGDDYGRSPDIDFVLACSSCGRNYPVCDGIPIMFEDEERMRVLVDRTVYKEQLEDARRKMERASKVSSDELAELMRENELIDALSWEILFWERWKQSDKGFVEHRLEEIQKYLERDREGGGRLRFLGRIEKYSDGGLNSKRLLNIGAGRYFLLERLIEEGCEVVAQDIVLEPLVLIKERGANFCICCDARFIPFRDDTFDISTSFGVLHHIWPIDRPISELLRVTSRNVHLNEPNYYALTRLALLLPAPLKRKLKRYYTGDYSHSPYENSIRPFVLKKIVEENAGRIVDMTFTRTSWISSEAQGAKKALRAFNLFLVNIAPIVSSHFDAIVCKGTTE